MQPVPRTALNLALQALLNKALTLDPISVPRLQPWSGQTLRLHLQPPDVVFDLVLDSGSVQVMSAADSAPQAQVSGTPLALLRYLTPNIAHVGDDPGYQVTGDSGLVHAFQQLLRDLQPDWESELAKYLGDVIAHAAGQRLRQGLQWGLRAGTSLWDDVGEYVAEEARVVPGRSEVRHRLQDVPELEAAVDRLALRIAALEQRLAAAQADDPSASAEPS